MQDTLLFISTEKNRKRLIEFLLINKGNSFSLTKKPPFYRELLHVNYMPVTGIEYKLGTAFSSKLLRVSAYDAVAF